jgi:hypothetical protein
MVLDTREIASLFPKVWKCESVASVDVDVVLVDLLKKKHLSQTLADENLDAQDKALSMNDEPPLII